MLEGGKHNFLLPFGPLGPCGAGPDVMGRDGPGPHVPGTYGPGPYGLHWDLMGLALMRVPGPLWARPL